MTIKLCIRMGAAMQTAALWMTIFLLLQHMGQHPSFTAKAEGSVIVSITRYFSIDNSIFITNFAGRVDFGNSAQVCRLNGALLTADQTPAAHLSITDYLRQLAPPGVAFIHTYMGGDAQYSVNYEPDPNKRCRRGVRNASLNCLYQWNMGFFTSEKVDNLGVAFYRGSLYSLPGAGPVNGYEPYWPAKCPAHGQTFLMSRLDMQAPETETTTWYDGIGYAGDNHGETPPESVMVVCAVQDGYVVNSSTTTLELLEDLSWTQKYWYVILILVLAPLLITTVLLVLFLCYCCGYDESRHLFPMVLRELNGAPLYAIGESEEEIKEDRDTSMSFPTPAPKEDFESSVLPVIFAREDLIYHDGDIFQQKR